MKKYAKITDTTAAVNSTVKAINLGSFKTAFACSKNCWGCFSVGAKKFVYKLMISLSINNVCVSLFAHLFVHVFVCLFVWIVD